MVESGPKDHLVGREERLGVLDQRRLLEESLRESKFGFAGVTAEHAAVETAHLRVYVRFPFHAPRERFDTLLNERAVHDEQLLERRGRGLALRAVHRGFGKIVELEERAEPPAADAAVDGSSVVARL